MTKVTLKGELHSSKEDLQQEIELLKENPDVLFLEGSDPWKKPKNIPQYRLWESWYSLAFKLFYIMSSKIYTDKMVLYHIAEVQNTKIKYTRETDQDILENASTKEKFGGLLVTSIGITLGIFLSLVSSFPVSLPYSLLIPLGPLAALVGLRKIESIKSNPRNRNKIIAEKIVGELDEAERFLLL
ncbi:MAG: hypothetical protein MAG715_00268 [Methanonatronarchaeales archaeon]|nr:hypothetical protein [Methanonatronarchaeales archaeon]